MSQFVSRSFERIRESYLYCAHESGLKIYLIPHEGKEAFALFGTRYGAMDRTFAVNGKPLTVPDGIAHFLEHKLFENSDGVDTFSRFAAVGAGCNAFTSNEMTAYLFQTTGAYHEALEILLDFVTHPYFTKETVQKEQGIIGQEIRMYDDDPDYQLYQGLLQALFVKHPLRIDIAGTVESIAQITEQTLYDCYHTFYNLNNMALVLCGPFEAEKVLSICDRLLSKAPEFTLTRPDPGEPDALCAKSVTKEFPISLPQFMLGLKETECGGDAHALLLRDASQRVALEYYFGRASDFFCSLYEKGQINETFNCAYQFLDTCAFTLFQGESEEPDAVAEAIRQTVRKAKEAPMNEADFIRCKKAVFGSAVQNFNAPSDLAVQMLSYLFVGADLFEMPDAVADLRLSDVQARVDSWREDLIAQSFIYPLKGKE